MDKTWDSYDQIKAIKVKGYIKGDFRLRKVSLRYYFMS